VNVASQNSISAAFNNNYVRAIGELRISATFFSPELPDQSENVDNLPGANVANVYHPVLGTVLVVQ
jgi:hypothetical protein